MKKKLFMFVLFAFGLLFVPNAYAKKAPVYEEANNLFFANGTAITIKARTDGVAGATITWDGGSVDVSDKVSVFGGSHNSNEIIEDVSITMNGGTVKNILGGGLHKSIVEKATIVMNNGTVSGSIMGGGAHHFHRTDDGDFVASSVADAKSRDTAVTIVDETNVTVNGGTISGAVWGGGESYSYTEKTTVTINAGKADYVVVGGSNGYTGKASLAVNGGEINVVQGVNRGEMDTITTVINGGKIGTVYAGGEPMNNPPKDVVSGVVNAKIDLIILDGEIGAVKAGTSGGINNPATDLVELKIDSSLTDKMDDSFDADNTIVTVNVTFTSGNESLTEQLPKGTKFNAEQLKELYDTINSQLAEDNLRLVGFYLDEDLTEEFDFSTPIEEDIELFLKVEELKNNEEIKNPETSDTNVIVLIGLIALGTVGLGYTIRKRKFN